MVPLTNMHFKYTVATVRSGPISAVGFIVKSQSPNHSQSETGFFCGELVGFWSGSGRILDEPSIGLHQRDNQQLLESLQRLRDLELKECDRKVILRN